MKPLSELMTGVSPVGRSVPNRFRHASSSARSASLARPRKANSWPMSFAVVAIDHCGEVGPAVRPTIHVGYVGGPVLVAARNDARRFAVKRSGDSGLSSAKAHLPP